MEVAGHIQNGVIVPTEGLSFPDGTEVTIIVHDVSEPKTEHMSAEERQRYVDALARLDGVINENPGDRFSGADHDQELYDNAK